MTSPVTVIRCGSAAEAGAAATAASPMPPATNPAAANRH